jgi:hypothetical protein
MFIDAALKLGRHADIERSVLLVGEDIDITRHAGNLLGLAFTVKLLSLEKCSLYSFS